MATKFMDKAKREKADEFYTQLADIENELRYYKEQFKNKVVFCNCDDPFESNFFKYFALNFNHLKLKKLIATSYDSSPIAFTQLSMFDCGKTVSNKNRKAYKIEITEVSDYNTDGAIDLADVRYLLKNKQNTLTILDGDGDFRSEECVALLKQSNIVVTNPPFSLFREYVAQIIGAGKDFIMIGNTNALTYKEIFKLFKENKIRTGNTNFNVGMYFYLETAISWINDGKIEEYMSFHQHDQNANELWLYFLAVISWVESTFIKYRKEMKGVNWGALYNIYKDTRIDTAELESEITHLMADDDVTSKKGIYHYVLTHNEKYLNIRAFTESQKRTVYERQNGNCPHCVAEHRKKIHYDISEMEADHITPWCEGGKTEIDNCHLLCKEHNRRKSSL